MGEYAELAIERYVNSFSGTKTSGKGIIHPPNEKMKVVLTRNQKRNLRTNARKKRKKERERSNKLNSMT